jgi:hypothetical protein
MKKLGTALLLALSLLSVTACGKKDKNNNANYNCGTQYGYSQAGCTGAYGQQYGQYGQPYGQQYGQYGGQMCQAGSVQTQFGCLQQGPCMAGYGYHPTALNGGPGCVQGSYGGQQYGGAGYYGGGYYGGGF